MVDFKNIEYLQAGSSRQQAAFEILHAHNVLSVLKTFDPILTGTFPIDIAIDSSDLDIICFFEDKEQFISCVWGAFGRNKSFKIRERNINNELSVVANFWIEQFEIEIFGQRVPTKQQFAYRHLLIEYKLLNMFGDSFRQQVIDLKNKGMKTEPAFAALLELEGDPYHALLAYEKLQDGPGLQD